MKSPIKIVVFGSLPSGFGGMETVFTEFSNYFNRDVNYQIDFCMYELNPGQNDYSWFQLLPRQLYRSNTQFRLLQKVKIRRFFKCYLSHHKPNIVIAYDALSIFLARKAISSVKHKIPLFSWIHFSLTTLKEKYQHYVLMADYHLAICDQIRDQFIARGATYSQCYIIYNPIIIPEYIIRRPEEDCVKLLYVGRVQYQDQKNLQECFHVLGDLAIPFRLDIVGSGTEKDITMLKTLAIQLNIDNKIFWHGWQKKPWDYVRTQVKTVSALLLTSAFEGFPMILCEALSRGIFCISSDCETGPRTVLNRINGLLYPCGAKDTLKECIYKFSMNGNIADPVDIKKSVNYLEAKNYFNHLTQIFSALKE